MSDHFIVRPRTSDIIWEKKSVLHSLNRICLTSNSEAV